ncbi:hypothetical protein GCM10011312_26540 [Planktosalinus lacus]|uniref:Secretion system C-terminal sorting domain-containing protein n=2 Tax=Planktosalinus lacus TaxID=1526573 RepID=A0A8J2VBC0_9FLAO|nr:hypothetical protein GCM10011312_26540 [Planktosalinus lacus]
MLPIGRTTHILTVAIKLKTNIMKNLLLLFLILISSLGYAQEPNPELFQTWYLNFVQSSDLGTPYEVSEIEPSITPNLIILEDYTFSGDGACNTFSGIFEFPNAETIQSSNFSNSNDDCDTEEHNFFENEYFSFMQDGGFYEITQEGSGLVLTISNAIFGQAVFRNFTLSTNDFDLNSIQIYPSPSSDLIFVQSKNIDIDKIEIINSIGQLSKTIISNFRSFDISDLPVGVYLIKIYTQNGILNKKIVKK